MPAKPRTPEMHREALRAYEQHGGRNAAARALGVPLSTFQHRLEAARSWRDEQNDGLSDKHQKRLDELASALESARKPKVKVKGKKRRRTRKGDFRRVIVPDSHGSLIDTDAAAAFLADLEELKPTEIVMLGDHLDCGGFLAQHHTMGYVADTEYTFEDDVAACNSFLDEIQRRVPQAEIHYLEGNHEHRVEQSIVKWCVNNPADAAFFHKMFSVPKVLHLGERGIHWYWESKKHHGLSHPATIKLGHCYFTHGSSTAKHAAANMLDDYGGNVVFGHTHRSDEFSKRTVTDGVIKAWCPGCLCRLQPNWMNRKITRWSHGYGLQLVSGDGQFMHMNVPIIEGKSLLSPMFMRGG